MGLILNNPSSYSFLRSVRKTILSNQMFRPGDKVLVAVSGGSDSVALFHVLRLLSHDFSINLSIAHLDHGLRGIYSKRDAFFTRSVANDFNVPFFHTSANILKVKRKLKLSLEESARKIRYAFLRKLVIEHSFTKVSLAHHMEDNAELLLMFMMRGSGLKGLSGMSPISNKYFVRPFIRIRKEKILKFLLNEGFKYVEDKSNNDLKFTRNKVRHYLMPILTESFNPGIVNSLNRTAILINSENKWMNEVVQVEYKRALIESNHMDKILLSVPVLKKLNIAVKRRIIRKALLLLLGSLKRITFVHVESILKLIKSNSGYKFLCLPNCTIIIKTYDKLEIKITKNIHHKAYEKPLLNTLDLIVVGKNSLPVSLQNSHYKFNFSIISSSGLPPWNDIEKNTVFFDLDYLQFPLTVRYALATDSFNPLGMNGNQRLKKYFLNKKVSLPARHSTTIVKDKNRIIWVVMHTICNYARITKTTKDVLKIEFYLLKVQ